MAKKSPSENGTLEAWIPYPQGKTTLKPADWADRLTKHLAKQWKWAQFTETETFLLHEYMLWQERMAALLTYQTCLPYPEDCGSEPSAWVQDLNRELEEREKKISRPPFTPRPYLYLWDKEKKCAILTHRENAQRGGAGPSRWMKTPMQSKEPVREGALEEAEELMNGAQGKEPDPTKTEGIVDPRTA